MLLTRGNGGISRKEKMESRCHLNNIERGGRWRRTLPLRFSTRVRRAHTRGISCCISSEGKISGSPGWEEYLPPAVDLRIKALSSFDPEGLVEYKHLQIGHNALHPQCGCPWHHDGL